MTVPNDELTRLLRVSADDLVDRAPRPGPDTASLWGRGRRTAWAARAAAGALVLLTVLLVAVTALTMRPAASTRPADGVTPRFPAFVSDLFPGRYRAGSGPVFGMVDKPVPGAGPAKTYVIDRSGVLATLPSGSTGATGSTLDFDGTRMAVSPDGLKIFTVDGIVDLTDGSVARVIPSSDAPRPRGTNRGVWSPDSRHVVVDTADGAVVLDEDATVVLEAGRGVLPAGWADDTTLLGVRTDAPSGLQVVTRPLGQRTPWTSAVVIDPEAPLNGQALDAAIASPDGTRLLLVYTAAAGSNTPRAALVDARTGKRLPFSGDTSPTLEAWDTCSPVWQGGEPLTASGGLHRPGDGSTVIGFSTRTQTGCVSMPGNALTGTADPNSAGATRERVWRLGLPTIGVLALIGAIWLALALRRSRRYGERFLPMIYAPPF